MKAKSRRRLLISSVAMLLVAMLALGTATFAWFTTDTKAKAENLSVTASKASTLEIKNNTDDWGTKISYHHPTTTANNESSLELIPASSADGTHWYNALAVDQDSYAAAATTGTDVSSTTDTHFFSDTLDIRNAGGKALKDVTIKFSLPASDTKYDYVRVALFETDSNHTFAATDFAGGIYANDSAQYKAVASLNAANTVVESNNISIQGNGNITINVTTAGDANSTLAAYDGTTYDTKYYKLFVWFEGQDPQCKNTNSGVKVPSIDFTVEGTPV